MPKVVSLQSETAPASSTATASVYSSGLPRSQLHHTRGFSTCRISASAGVRTNSFRSPPARETGTRTGSFPRFRTISALTGRFSLFCRRTRTQRSAVLKLSTSRSGTTYTSSMDTAPVVCRVTGRVMPIDSSSGRGFQSTKPMFRSPFCARRSLTSSLLRAFSWPVTSYFRRMNTPKVVSAEASCFPFRKMSA